jgi:hypothetical protein
MYYPNRTFAGESEKRDLLKIGAAVTEIWGFLIWSFVIG